MEDDAYSVFLAQASRAARLEADPAAEEYVDPIQSVATFTGRGASAAVSQGRLTTADAVREGIEEMRLQRPPESPADAFRQMQTRSRFTISAGGSPVGRSPSRGQRQGGHALVLPQQGQRRTTELVKAWDR